MFEELTVGEYRDWQDYHRQFNLRFDKADEFWAIHIADFKNANRADGADDVTPIEILPWRDPYSGDKEFLAQMHGLATYIAQSKPQEA